MYNTKRSKSKTILFGLIYAIIFIAYNAVLFAVAGFTLHGPSFWISYVFMLAAFLIIPITAILFKDKGMQPRDWMFGFPILKHATIYIIVEFIVSVIFMLLDLIDCIWFIPFSFQLIILAFYLVMAISCYIAKETMKDVRVKVKESTTFIKLLQADVEMVAERANDEETKKLFKELGEKVRFSDPMSNPALFELEKQISFYVSQANTAVTVNDKDAAMRYYNLANQSLLERNKKCKALK